MDFVNVSLAAAPEVVNDFYYPVVMEVSNFVVTVARHLVVQLRDGGRDRVRVQVTLGRNVLQPDHIAIGEEPDGTIGIVRRLVPAGKDLPVIVLVLVMVAGHLLLV